MQPVRIATLDPSLLRAASETVRHATSVFTRHERAQAAQVMRDAHARGIVSPKTLLAALGGASRDHGAVRVGQAITRHVRSKLTRKLPSLATVRARTDPTFDSPAHRASVASLIRSLIKVGAYDCAAHVPNPLPADWSPVSTLDAAVAQYSQSVGKRMARVLGMEHLSLADVSLEVIPAVRPLSPEHSEHAHGIFISTSHEMIGETPLGPALLPHVRLVSDALRKVQLWSVDVVDPCGLARGDMVGSWAMESLAAYVSTTFDADDNFVVSDEMAEHLSEEHGIDLSEPEDAARAEKALRFLREDAAHPTQPVARVLRYLKATAAENGGAVAAGLNVLGAAVKWSSRRKKPEGLCIDIDDPYESGGLPCTFAFKADCSGYEEMFLEDMGQHCMEVGGSVATILTGVDPFAQLTVALEDAWATTFLVHALGASPE